MLIKNLKIPNHIITGKQTQKKTNPKPLRVFDTIDMQHTPNENWRVNNIENNS